MKRNLFDRLVDKFFIRTLLLLGCTFAVQITFAQDKVKIGGGGGKKNGSTYSEEVFDIAQTCSTDSVTYEEFGPGGGVANLQELKDNQVSVAIVPSDLLYQARQENGTSVAQIQQLFALHPEPVHLIVRADVKKEGGFNLPGIGNVGGKDVVYNHPEDLRGREIGATGGSAVSARVISDKLGIGWTVNSAVAKDTLGLLNSLSAHQVDAILIVGSPAAVKAIKGNFKILPLLGNSNTAEVYSQTKVQYPNLNEGRPVDTFSEQALLVTRTWHSDEKIAQLAALRSCLKHNLSKLQDKEGASVAWQDVKSGQSDKWQWYDLPDASAPVATLPPSPGKKPAKK